MVRNTSCWHDSIKPLVVITGALAGLCRATSLAFGEAGHRVAISGRKEEAGKDFLSELRGLGVEAEFVRADVRHEDEVSRSIDVTVTYFGRLDAAVNNAGVDGKFNPISEQTPEEYRAVFDANVLGTLLSMKHEMRAMKAQGFGSIVNLSSSMGGSARASPNRDV